MKKMLVGLLGSVLLLSACGDETQNEAETEEGTVTESNEETAATEDVTSTELIDNAVEASSDIKSYEAQQSFNIELPDGDETIRTIMTYGEQDELKLEVDNNGDIVTHYIEDGNHSLYNGDEIIDTEETVDVSGNDYQSIVEMLTAYPEGEVNSTEDGYIISVNIEDASAFNNFIDEETKSAIDAAESISGTLQLYFDGEYMFTGSELTAVIVSEGEEINIHSTVDYTNIGNVDVIEKPNNM